MVGPRLYSCEKQARLYSSDIQALELLMLGLQVKKASTNLTRQLRWNARVGRNLDDIRSVIEHIEILVLRVFGFVSFLYLLFKSLLGH